MSDKIITTETIKKIAVLSKLELSEIEICKFADEFSEIVGFVDKLQELDIKDAEPLEQVLEGESFLRDDVVKLGSGVAEMLKNAPDQVQNLIKVPKVIG